jgi:hypothetical protein
MEKLIQSLMVQLQYFMLVEVVEDHTDQKQQEAQVVKVAVVKVEDQVIKAPLDKLTKVVAQEVQVIMNQVVNTLLRMQD